MISQYILKYGVTDFKILTYLITFTHASLVPNKLLAFVL